MKTLLSSLLFAGMLAFLGTGCRMQQINDKAEREIDSIHADTESLLFTAECPDGAVLRSQCGLIATRVAMPDFRQTFAEKKCADVSTEQCQERFDAAVNAWTAQRYMLADVGAVEEACNAHPGRCDDSKVYESMLMASHNITASHIDERREGAALERRDIRLAMEQARTTEDVVLVGLLTTTVVAGTLAPHHHRHW